MKQPPVSAGTTLAGLATWAGEQQASGDLYGAILGAARERRAALKRDREGYDTSQAERRARMLELAREQPDDAEPTEELRRLLATL